MQVRYREVPGEPVAWSGERAAAWQAALVRFGFRPVGVLEKQLPPLAPEGLPVVDVPAWDPAAQARIGVLASPEWRAFAVAEPYLAEPLLSLRTITAAGKVVETTLVPEGQPAEPPATLTATVFGGRWLSRLGERFGRQQADWIRTAHPAAGYYLEVVDAGAADSPPAEALWAQHQARLAALLPEADIPPHDNLPLYVALLQRTETVAETMARRRERVGVLSAWALSALALLAAVALPLYILAQGGLAAVSLASLTWLGVGLLALMLLLLALQPLLRRLAARPGALRPVPAAELLEQVRTSTNSRFASGR